MRAARWSRGAAVFVILGVAAASLFSAAIGEAQSRRGRSSKARSETRASAPIEAPSKEDDESERAAEPSPDAESEPETEQPTAPGQDDREASADTDRPEEPGSVPLAFRPRLIEASFEIGIMRRQLRYRDDLFDHLPDYALGAAPSIAGEIAIYPFTFLSNARIRRWLEGLGFGVDYERDFIRASSREGLDFRTYGARFEVEARYALYLGRFRAAAGLGYARRSFAIDAARAVPGVDNLPRIPNIRYQGLRLVGAGAFRISRLLSIGGHAAYLFLFDVGPIGGPLYFPKDHAGAFDVGVYLGVRVHGLLELRVGAELQRAHHRFDPDPGDRYIVGGASDRFSRFYVGANLAY